MAEAVYQERRAAIQLTIGLLVGLSTLLGGVAGAFWQRRAGDNR
jgi:hypothetical protein